MTRVYLSLGSNIEPVRHLRAAIDELRAEFGDIAVSPVYRFAAVGFEGPPFLNLAVGVDTAMDAPSLDTWLHALEDRHGRRRDGPRFSSRTLDVDIVLYGDAVLSGPGHLRVPREEMNRSFVLQPLADIAPDTVHPQLQRTIGELWNSGYAAGERGTAVTL